jgi:hypothetical protein
MISAVSCVSSSTRPPCAPTTNGQSPPGAAGQKANLIRVLKATMKGPGAAPSTRLSNGLQRPRTSGVSGQPPPFSPRNGRHPQGGTAADQQNAGNRCADRRFCRSRPTVGAIVMRSIGGSVCVHPVLRSTHARLLLAFGITSFLILCTAVCLPSDHSYLEGCSGCDARPSLGATGEGVWRGGAGPGTFAL